MDVDRFIATNRSTWERLDTLSTRASRRVDRLSAEELDELVRLYLRASSHLSTARTVFAEPALTARLTRLVGRAGALIYGSRARTWRSALTFVAVTFPAAVWHIRRAIAVSAVLFGLSALVVGVWIARSPAAYEAAMPPEVREAYLTEDFEAYYSSQPAAQFASWVFTNNVRVAVLAFAGGIGACVLTGWVLVANGAHLGVAAGLFHASGMAPRFWGLILPHGLLELTAVAIAGGAGLQVGWALIAPGDRSRRAALADEGRRSIVVVTGLVAAFLLAALIEALVTPSGLPTWARVGIGLAIELAFLTYLGVQGRLAAQEGLTGALGEADHGWLTTAPQP